MRIDVFSIFPEMVDHIADQSVIGRGRRDGVLDIRVHDLRQTTTDVHQTVDDAPFGGGAGMVMMPEPLFGAVEAVEPPRPLFYLSPSGRRFDQSMATNSPNSTASRCCAAATKVSTSGSANICATARSRLVMSSSPVERLPQP